MTNNTQPNKEEKKSFFRARLTLTTKDLVALGVIGACIYGQGFIKGRKVGYGRGVKDTFTYMTHDFVNAVNKVGEERNKAKEG